jgi:methionyl-tRNA formyltransferase
VRIVFFGATDLGYACCEALIQAGHDVVGIFTIEQNFNISYSPGKPVHNVLFKDFTFLRTKHNIPVYVINGDIKSYQEQFEALNPDFILAIGWYYMIPAQMLDITSKGGAGIHASLLPKFRGNAPLVWAMIEGKKETGLSFFYFADGVDEGDIIAQKKFPIEHSDTIREILEKTKNASVEVLLEQIPLIAKGTAARISQNHEEATLFPKRSPKDGLIDWTWDSDRIRNFIRAQTKPYPGAFTIINGKKVIIYDADIIDVKSHS